MRRSALGKEVIEVRYVWRVSILYFEGKTLRALVTLYITDIHLFSSNRRIFSFDPVLNGTRYLHSLILV